MIFPTRNTAKYKEEEKNYNLTLQRNIFFYPKWWCDPVPAPTAPMPHLSESFKFTAQTEAVSFSLFL